MLWRMPRRSEGIPEEFVAYKAALRSAIGARIRTRRLELDLSQEVLRARMELENAYISSGQMSRIETGESLPTLIDLIALIKVLQVSCNWLLFGDEDVPSNTL